jgi:seryl-tRNA synthetase
MIDIELVRQQGDDTQAALLRRGFAFDMAAFSLLDQVKKQAQQAAEALFAEQNILSKRIGVAKQSGDDSSALFAEGESLRVRADMARAAFDQADAAMASFLAIVPNIPHPDVPDGKGEADNVVLRQVGERPTFAFPVKEHDALGAKLNGLDFDAAVQMSGSRFSVMHGQIARLHRALIQFMLNTHIDEGGYAEVDVPYLVRPEALFGTGQLPKFEEDLFKLERDGLYLIPTAEVPVTNLVANKTIPVADLPLAFVCHTPCFRREAGSAGRDVKGLIRQHQFQKVELVRMCTADDVDSEFEILLASAESILKKLDLPYRVVSLCAGDLGFSAEKTVDLEVWMPGQNAWREISSVSQFGSFQARRMKARYKGADKKNRLLCTLNGSGLAAGRALVAVMENFQQADGSILVPPVLQPYMNGATVITPGQADFRRK